MTADAGPFVHPAFFYRSDDEYLAVLVPFVTDGLAAGQPVAVAVPEQRLAVLRSGLGADADAITMINMQEAGRNPGRIIAGVLRRFADAHPDRHVRIVGEPIWAERTPVEYPACVQHEALINPAFAGRDVTIICPYDTSRLPGHVVADAYATHPEVWLADDRRASAEYDWDGVVARYNEPLNGRVDGMLSLDVAALGELPAARQWVTDRAAVLGLAPHRLPDLELIANELVVNGIVHGGGSAHVRLWADDEHLVCEVTDPGQWTDPLAGRRPPVEGQLSGRGLLLVHGLSDLVRTHTAPGRTTIRAYLRFDRA
ncbi:anti-sigma factor RsbA family regulatory protein [Actinophytocola sp. KF-1]